jgi:hypothetical protein
MQFDLKQTSTVALEVHNVLGQRAEYWNYGMLDAGRCNENITLDAFASGVYFYKLVASGVEPTAVGNDGQEFVPMKRSVLMEKLITTRGGSGTCCASCEFIFL